MSNKLLSVDDLIVRFEQKNESSTAVSGISFTLLKNEILGIVGESGSGKSVTSLSILNLLNGYSSSVTSGSIRFYDEHQIINILDAKDQDLNALRGKKIAMVFQEPMSSLNPVKKCGWQIEEVLKIHNITSPANRRERVKTLLKSVQLHDTERIIDSYPHELSGGQLQRVNIAMALAGEPKLLICDEPTTALDVTVQKEIIELLKRLTSELDLSMIFVSHDLDLVAQLCKSIAVMYQGQIVEYGKTETLFSNPQHPYTKALLNCRPNRSNHNYVLPTVDSILNGTYKREKREEREVDSTAKVILEVKNLSVQFRLNPLSIFGRKKYFKAVDDVSFQIKKGEILGIVGESGSGKSTIANCISGIVDYHNGKILFDNQLITQKIFRRNPKLRKAIQIVFQDPYSSLNPKMSIGRCLMEPTIYHRIKPKEEAKEFVYNLLEQVGLNSTYFDRLPHELSGGQRQRVCIARALSVQPEMIICDESVSALDVSVQAQILNLLDKLRVKLGLTIIFISHDLSVVEYICDNVLVLKDGRIVEQGITNEILNNPSSDYTRRLVDSMPLSI